MKTSQALKIIFLKVSKTVDKQWHHLPQLLNVLLVRDRSCNTFVNIILGKTGSQGLPVV